MSTISGWQDSTTAARDTNLLNSAAWTIGVREFCSLIGHVLPSHGRDRDYECQYHGCHVEKRLILCFVCIVLSAWGEDMSQDPWIG